jgi:hypothetical protein
VPFEAEVASTPRLRPWIDLGAAVDEVLANLKSVVRHYLLGSGAETPLEAQREARSLSKSSMVPLGL